MFRYQRGLSTTSILLGVLFVIMLVRGMVSLVPMYWDNVLVGQVLDQLDESGKIQSTKRNGDVKKLIQERLNANNLSMSLDEMVVTSSDRGVKITWTYEARDHFIGNLDFVSTFQHIKDFAR